MPMTRTPRLIGYALMALTLVAALGAKQGWFTGIGPVPAAAVAIILGALGVMLVVTHLMVSAMIGQTNALAEAEAEAEAGADVGAVDRADR
jgi:hypothetical protein